MATSMARGPEEALVGIWMVDEGYQTVQLLFRPGGRYQMDTRSKDSSLDYSATERGRYKNDAQTLTLSPYDYYGEPVSKQYAVELKGTTLTLTRTEFPITQIYEF